MVSSRRPGGRCPRWDRAHRRHDRWARPVAPGRRRRAPGRRGSGLRRPGPGTGSIRSSTPAPGPASAWSWVVPASARTRALDLDAESFAAGPFGGTTLIGSDDGRRSRLSLVDAARGCAWPLVASRDVIRTATLAPDGTSLFEFRVDRQTRADLGVWRRALDGSAAPARVLAPIAADARFGPTWTTDLVWSEDGGTLAVQSCGEISCRVRILDPRDGGVRLVADPAPCRPRRARRGSPRRARRVPRAPLPAAVRGHRDRLHPHPRSCRRPGGAEP